MYSYHWSVVALLPQSEIAMLIHNNNYFYRRKTPISLICGALRHYFVLVNKSGPIAMHKTYKSNDILCDNTLGVKKVWPSKV